MFADHETGRRLAQALADAYLRHALPECVLDALQQSLALPEARIVLLAIGVAREPPELEVPARGVLEALALVAVELAHHPLVRSEERRVGKECRSGWEARV